MSGQLDADTKAWLKACTEITTRRGPHNADGTMSSGVCAAILARYDSLKAEALASHHEARVAEGLPVGDDPNDTIKMLTEPREWHTERATSATQETKAMSKPTEDMEAKIAAMFGNPPPKSQPAKAGTKSDKVLVEGNERGWTTHSYMTVAERDARAQLSENELKISTLMGLTPSQALAAKRLPR